MPKQDHERHRPATRFPSYSTAVALIEMQPRLAATLRNIFGEQRALEILFDTLPWRQKGLA